MKKSYFGPIPPTIVSIIGPLRTAGTLTALITTGLLLPTLLIITSLFLSAARVNAQSCPFKPADCPDKDYAAAERSEDSAERMANPIVPQEVTMEYHLRALTGDFVRRLAARQHWEEPVELTEGGSSGYRAPDESVLTYSLRPPHSFSITWEVIVNKDSLKAWQTWTEDFLKRSLALVDQYKQAASTQTSSASGLEHLPVERKTRTLQFRDASVLLIQFDFNAERADPPEGEGATAAGSYTIPGCALARQYYSGEPDILEAVNTYAHFRNTALILVGPWNTRPTANGYGGYYESPFYADKKARDHTSPKKIPCDLAQGLHVWLSGNHAAIQALLSGSALTPLRQWLAPASGSPVTASAASAAPPAAAP